MPTDTRIFSIKTLSHEKALPDTATFKQDKGSHLLLLSLLRFKPHIKGDSETALPILVVPISGVVKNSAKVLSYY